MRNDFESNYLAHHGILGMHWGRRNGPPYPLDAPDLRHEYDNRTSEHWVAKRNMSTRERLEIERRYNAGESKGAIMKSMRLI